MPGLTRHLHDLQGIGFAEINKIAGQARNDGDSNSIDVYTKFVTVSIKPAVKRRGGHFGDGAPLFFSY